MQGKDSLCTWQGKWQLPAWLHGVSSNYVFWEFFFLPTIHSQCNPFWLVRLGKENDVPGRLILPSSPRYFLRVCYMVASVLSSRLRSLAHNNSSISELIDWWMDEFRNEVSMAFTLNQLRVQWEEQMYQQCGHTWMSQSVNDTEEERGRKELILSAGA